MQRLSNISRCVAVFCVLASSLTGQATASEKVTPPLNTVSTSDIGD